MSDISTPHLRVHSLDDTRDDVKHVHFGVALGHLLQQLEEQPENRLEVLKKGGMMVLRKEDKNITFHTHQNQMQLQKSGHF